MPTVLRRRVAAPVAQASAPLCCEHCGRPLVSTRRADEGAIAVVDVRHRRLFVGEDGAVRLNCGGCKRPTRLVTLPPELAARFHHPL